LTTVIIPAQNEKDLVEIPPEIRKKMTFHPVTDMDEVVKIAFNDELKKKAVKK